MIGRTNSHWTLAIGAALTMTTVACASEPAENGDPTRTLPTTSIGAADVDVGRVAGERAEPAHTGPLCDLVPNDGDGSFSAMANDPVGIAASNNPALATLVAAMVETRLIDTVNSEGPFTLFAPINSGFGGDDVARALTDWDALNAIVELHVVAGERLSSDDLARLDSVETIGGESVAIHTADDGNVTVNGQAMVGCADVQTANATVHIIDVVLRPAG